MKNSLEKVIVALDYPEPKKAFRLIDELGDQIKCYKVGPMLYTRSGMQIVEYLHKKSKQIFLDLKLHDTPNVVADTIKQFGEMGIHYATVHCLGGRAMLEAACASCRGYPLKILGVTVLTSHEEEASRDFGLPLSGNALVMRLLNLAIETRLAGILCSPQEIEQVRQRVLPGFLLVTPGIRLVGEEVFGDDQKRISSPKEALAWGSDLLVIGRPITLAREPKEVLSRLFQ